MSKSPRGTRKNALVLKRKAPMLQTSSSKTEEAMTERLAALEPGTQRYFVLAAAIDFKRSWVVLAKHLCEVKQSASFKEWGFRTFEAYAQHELHVRRETSQKLVRSFDFLLAHERPMLEEIKKAETAEKPIAPLPNYQALDILAEARQNPNLAEQDYKEIRDQVFREDLAPNAVKKMVKERAPEQKKVAVEDPMARLRKALTMAERLYGILVEEEVSDEILKSVEEAVGGLRKMIEE